MATRKNPDGPTTASRLHATPEDMQAEAVLNKARQVAIPLAVIAIVVIVFAFVNTARQEAVRKANAAAYAELAKADEFDAPFEQDQDKIAENRRQQREVYEKVVAEHADTPAALEAKFRLAALELAAGNFVKAETLFGELRQAELSAMQQDAAMTGHANALIGLEKFDEAMALLDQLAGRTDSPLADGSKYRAAVVAYRKGDLEVAKQHLDDLLAADDVDAEAQRLAEQFLERLELFDADTVKASFEKSPEPEPEAKDGADGASEPPAEEPAEQ